MEAPPPADTPIAAATGALALSASFTFSPATSDLQHAATNEARSRRTLVRQVQIIARARKCAADDIFILQLARLVNNAQNPALRNVFLPRLVHYQNGTSSAFLELELGIQGGGSQVES
jgi:hypothetical protein